MRASCASVVGRGDAAGLIERVYGVSVGSCVLFLSRLEHFVKAGK